VSSFACVCARARDASYASGLKKGGRTRTLRRLVPQVNPPFRCVKCVKTRRYSESAVSETAKGSLTTVCGGWPHAALGDLQYRDLANTETCSGMDYASAKLTAASWAE